MKHLEKIKLGISLLLVLFGIYFGIRMLSYNTGNAGISTISTTFAINGITPVATYVPI